MARDFDTAGNRSNTAKRFQAQYVRRMTVPLGIGGTSSPAQAFLRFIDNDAVNATRVGNVIQLATPARWRCSAASPFPCFEARAMNTMINILRTLAAVVLIGFATTASAQISYTPGRRQLSFRWNFPMTYSFDGTVNTSSVGATPCSGLMTPPDTGGGAFPGRLAVCR